MANYSKLPINLTQDEIVSIKERLKKHVKIDPKTSCWNWCDSSTNDYGRLRIKRRNYKTHRLSYELYVSSIPGNLLVCHKCDNRKCINPEHLFLGTHSDNAEDMFLKNRHPRKGKARVLDTILAEWMREDYSSGSHTMQELGLKYNVSTNTVSRVIRKVKGYAKL